MNQVTHEQKDRVMKTLAIVGFVAVIMLGVWLAVQIVSLMPKAFSSLASIADGVYNYQDTVELEVTTQNSVVNSGSAFLVGWNKVPKEGSYTFSYACTDGVSVDVRDDTGNESVVSCGEMLHLGKDTASLEVTIASERRRFTDVAYTIGFVEEGHEEALATSHNMITVVNPSIPQSDVIAQQEDENDTNPEDTEEDVTEDNNQTPVEDTDTEDTAADVPLTPSEPEPYVDLAVTLVAVGELDANGNFIKRASIDEDARGAFQFEVKNVGTKASGNWNFDATLTSGVVYTSPAQASLGTQDRILFTLGYDDVGGSGVKRFGVNINNAADVNAENDYFAWAVTVTE